MSAEQTTLKKALKMGKEEKQQLIEAIKKEAHNNEVLYWGCSQAVLSALQRQQELFGVNLDYLLYSTRDKS